MEHPHVAEAACVGFPHEVKGEGVYAFVIPKQGGGLDFPTSFLLSLFHTRHGAKRMHIKMILEVKLKCHDYGTIPFKNPVGRRA